MGFVDAVEEVAGPGVTNVVFTVTDWPDLEAGLQTEEPGVIARLSYQMQREESGSVRWPVVLEYLVDYRCGISHRMERIELREPIDPNELMDMIYEFGGTPNSDVDALFDAFLLAAMMDSQGLCEGPLYLPEELQDALDAMENAERRDVLNLGGR